MTRASAKTTGRAGGVALCVWFALMVLLGAGLLARHAVAFSAPSASAKLAASLNALRPAPAQGGWFAVHALYADCRCSQRVQEHLLAGGRPPDWTEVVLWVGAPAGGPEPTPELERRFDVRRITPQDLAALGIESAPMLIALDPQGRIRYAGGYTERKQGPVIDDTRILAEVRLDAAPPSLPLFGCAVSDRLRRQLSLLPVP
ncbi:MAG TPA: hypothetical protein VK841_01395 [Polyangiaceae bacterium]|jgi:hypothetical protein|nr:hypothetical protein [Polyangiaceae bacterium]